MTAGEGAVAHEGTRPRAGFLDLLDPEDREALAALGEPRRFMRGDVLMRQGEPTDFVVVIRDGNVKVTVDMPDGRAVVYAVYGPNDVVGEFEALGDYEVREANVVALDGVNARVISREAFVDFLLGHPAVSLALVRILTRRLGVADRRRSGGTSVAAAMALAAYLVELADGRGQGSAPVSISVPLRQEDLASLIGVSRNSLVRALAILRVRGLVETDRASVTIRDVAGLRLYAEDPAVERGT